MITISNALSFCRVPLAFVFLFESPTLRFYAIMLAMITDSVDGYLARRSQSVSRFGAILDPATDKFFVYFALAALVFEGHLLLWQAAAMLLRDLMVFLYGLFMIATGRWKAIVFRSIRAGKITTALQFLVLLGIVFQFSFSWITYGIFIVMALISCVELFQMPERFSSRLNHDG